MFASGAASKLWQFEEIDQPELPKDLPSATYWKSRGRDFRGYTLNSTIYNCEQSDCRYALRSGLLVDQLNDVRRTLWNLLTDQQKATLYWYGFVEERNWKRTKSSGWSDLLPRGIEDATGFFRIHVCGSIGLTSLFPNKDERAKTGYCCYLPYAEFTETNMISNLLALRTDPIQFANKACKNPTVEEQAVTSYHSFNNDRMAREREELKTKRNMFGFRKRDARGRFVAN